MPTSRSAIPAPTAIRTFLTGVARAFGGALIFSLPMLMTMEMWSIGFYIDPLRLALLTLVSIPLLVGLSHFSGIEPTFRWWEDLEDACIAYGVGWICSAVVLSLFAVITPDQSIEATIGQIAIQAIPASIGALLARSLLGSREREQVEAERRKEHTGYGGEIFLMAVGAIFLAMNVAPTEEMILISYKMTVWHTLLMIVLSLAIMHAFVFAVEFHGSHAPPPGSRFWNAFLRFTVVGYAVALLMSVYILWTFGRMDGLSLTPLLQTIVVLGFPAAIGAAAARLII